MNKRNINQQTQDFRDSRKISKSLEVPDLDLVNVKLPDWDEFSLKTLSNSTIDSSRDSFGSNSSCMNLRSRRRCAINPFDLSSDCGDSDILEIKYSLRSKKRQLHSKSSSMGDGNKNLTCTVEGVAESTDWSQVDSYSMTGDICDMYEFLGNAPDKKLLEQESDKNKTRSSNNESDYEDQDKKKPKLAFCYELRQRHHRSYQRISNQPSPLPIMRESSLNHLFIPEISNQTLSDLLVGRYSCYLSDYTIIDCRFPYEYDGGHISNSLNVYTCRQMMQYLSQSSQPDMEQDFQHVLKLLESPNSSEDDFDTKAFIFYCEFSSFRGPKLAECLRGLDKLANHESLPRLRFPHVYVLHGGYNEFFIKYPEHCTPQGYISMKQTRYSLRSPINPYLMNNSPTKHGNVAVESDVIRTLNVLTPKLTDEMTCTVYRKQQINCQRQLQCDIKRLVDIVQTITKNKDIIRFFKLEEIF